MRIRTVLGEWGDICGVNPNRLAHHKFVCFTSYATCIIDDADGMDGVWWWVIPRQSEYVRITCATYHTHILHTGERERSVLYHDRTRWACAFRVYTYIRHMWRWRCTRCVVVIWSTVRNQHNDEKCHPKLSHAIYSNYMYICFTKPPHLGYVVCGHRKTCMLHA